MGVARLAAKRSVILATVCWSPWGCAEARDAGGVRVVERDSAGTVVVEVVGDPASLPRWQLGSEPESIISGDEEPFFSSIGEVAWLENGRLAVEDNGHDAIYLFGADGALERTLGEQGDGPGQFQAVTAVTVLAGDSIYAYDRQHRRVSLFDPDAGFVTSYAYGPRSTGAPLLDVLALGGGRFAVRGYGPSDPGDRGLPTRVATEEHLEVTGWAGEGSYGSVMYPGIVTTYMEWAFTTASWSPEAFVAARNGRVAHGTGARFELTIRDRDLRPLRSVRWEGWDEPISDEELEAAKRWYESVSTLPDEYRRQVLDAQYTRTQLPALRPTLAAEAFIDPLGRIWVARYQGPGPAEERTERWYVLSGVGHPIGTLDLPPGTTLAAVSSERVARDELDVQSVHVFRFSR